MDANRGEKRVKNSLHVYTVICGPHGLREDF